MVWKINDPIWGSISFHSNIEESVKKVIDSPLIQRLRYTSQLGLAQLVYPSATHSRFSHSIGVAYLADQVSSAIKLDDEERLSFVLAALLHDFGHPPFSHAFLRGIKNKFESLKKKGLFSCLDNPCDDKSWGKQIDESLEKLYELMTERIQENVKNILYGSHPLACLLNSDIDLDRMDYLCRDAHFCGLPYAADGSYLINNILYDDSSILFKGSAVTACEGILLSRLQMTKSVYQHPIVKTYEEYLERILAHILEQSSPICEASAPSFFCECMKEHPDEKKICVGFLELSESDMWSYLKQLSKQEYDPKIHEYADSIVNRTSIKPSISKIKCAFYKGRTSIKKDSGVENLKGISQLVLALSDNGNDSKDEKVA